MQRSMTRIRTSHVGRLPSPKGWEELPGRLSSAEDADSEKTVTKNKRLNRNFKKDDDLERRCMSFLLSRLAREVKVVPANSHERVRGLQDSAGLLAWRP